MCLPFPRFLVLVAMDSMGSLSSEGRAREEGRAGEGGQASYGVGWRVFCSFPMRSPGEAVSGYKSSRACFMEKVLLC